MIKSLKSFANGNGEKDEAALPVASEETDGAIETTNVR